MDSDSSVYRLSETLSHWQHCAVTFILQMIATDRLTNGLFHFCSPAATQYPLELRTTNITVGGEEAGRRAVEIVDGVLQVLERGKVALETTTSSSPGVFKPTDSDDYIHVVMPMFVQW